MTDIYRTRLVHEQQRAGKGPWRVVDRSTVHASRDLAEAQAAWAALVAFIKENRSQWDEQAERMLAIINKLGGTES